MKRKGNEPDGDVTGVLMSVHIDYTNENTSTGPRHWTCMRVDPEDDGGGLRAQDALQRAHSDAVVPAERDGNAAGSSFPATQ